MLTTPSMPRADSKPRSAPSPKAPPNDPYRNPRYASVRTARTIAFIAVVATEFLVAWGGNRTHFKPKPIVKEEDSLVQIVMPKLEPDPVEDVSEQSQDAPAADQIAPPMQADVPQIVTPESFVQQIEPPPPELSDLSKTIVRIPVNRMNFSKMTVLDISQLDQIPRAKFMARPAYPFEMIRAGNSGRVLVDFIVDTEGNVRNAVAASSTHVEFEDAAVDAVRKWKFTPGRKNNHAVNTHMQVPILFNLEKQLEQQ
jgi:protein TonB